MGSIMSTIRGDIDDYERLCKKYGEKTVYWGGSADCYGKHAEELKKREREEDYLHRIKLLQAAQGTPKSVPVLKQGSLF